MASTFKNGRLAVGTSYSTIYTCPASTTAIVIGLQAANIDGSNNVDVSAQWLDASAANAATRIVHTVNLPADAALGLLDGKLVLESGDAVQLMASASSDAEASIAVLELT